MGEAKRRGTFEQRKAEAIERRRIKHEALENERAERLKNMTPEERRVSSKAKNEFLEMVMLSEIFSVGRK